jgi:hypothetical protein
MKGFHDAGVKRAEILHANMLYDRVM